MHAETAHASAALVARFLLAALFIFEGWSKLRGYEAAGAYMQRGKVSPTRHSLTRTSRRIG